MLHAGYTLQPKHSLGSSAPALLLRVEGGVGGGRWQGLDAVLLTWYLSQGDLWRQEQGYREESSGQSPNTICTLGKGFIFISMHIF